MDGLTPILHVCAPIAVLAQTRRSLLSSYGTRHIILPETSLLSEEHAVIHAPATNYGGGMNDFGLRDVSAFVDGCPNRHCCLHPNALRPSRHRPSNPNALCPIPVGTLSWQTAHRTRLVAASSSSLLRPIKPSWPRRAGRPRQLRRPATGNDRKASCCGACPFGSR